MSEDTTIHLLRQFVNAGCKKKHPSGYYYECRYCLDSADSDTEHYPDCLWLRAKNHLKKLEQESL